MVGSAIVRELKKQGYNNIITRSHEELDLCKQDDTEAFFENEDLDALQDELNRESDNSGKAHKQEGGFLNAIKNLGANRK